jgi:dipeptidyl-peptidase 4
MRPALRRLALACVIPCLACSLVLCASSQTLPSKPLTIDRLYSLPWIIGTRPEQPQWSPDSNRLAFLWNNEGTDFLDVWITDVKSGKPSRLTSMPRPEMPNNPGTDINALKQLEHAETDHGISALAWSSDGTSLLFVFHGQAFQVAPGSAPKRVFPQLQDVSELVPAPAASTRQSDFAAITGEGQVWVSKGAGTPSDSSSDRLVYKSETKDVGAEEIYWSNDGTRIALIEADSRQMPVRGIPDYLADETRLAQVKRPFPGEPSEARRLGVVSLKDAKTTWAQLDGQPMDLIFGVSWSPDDKTLLVDRSDLYIKDRRLLVIQTDTGTSSLLLREQDPKNVTAEWWSTWAPDGRGVYFTSDRDNDYHLYFKSLAAAPDAASPVAVTSGNYAVFSASLPSAAKALFVVTNQGRVEERQAFRVSLTGGKPQQLTSSPGTHTPVPSPDGRYLADVFSSDSTPPDLYLVDTAKPNDPEQQITHSPLPEFSQYLWSIAKYVDFPNIHDGTNLHARLTLPPNFDPKKKYPAILGSVYSNSVHNQWGGRIFHPTWGLDQYLAQQGYVIMNVDISGSSGYGKSFRQRIAQDYGGIDVEDLYSATKYLVAQGYVDEHRIGIWGSSYGGLLTSTSLFVHPDAYQAGVAGAPATSLFHALTGEMRTMMAPQDHQEQYARSSAFLKSGGLENHLMIIHGMKDQIVLFKDSVTLEERLILQGKDVTLTVLPNAPHGWDTEGLAQTRYAYKKLIDYFKTYLGEGPDK